MSERESTNSAKNTPFFVPSQPDHFRIDKDDQLLEDYVSSSSLSDKSDARSNNNASSSEDASSMTNI